MSQSWISSCELALCVDNPNIARQRRSRTQRRSIKSIADSILVNLLGIMGGGRHEIPTVQCVHRASENDAHHADRGSCCDDYDVCQNTNMAQG